MTTFFPHPLDIGDYVLATKYSDGDPHDHWCVGIVRGFLLGYSPRILVEDCNGQLFRANGFRRAKRISRERGDFIIAHMADIESSDRSLWWWLRCPMEPSAVRP